MQSSPAFLENQISIICTYWQTSQELQFCKAKNTVQQASPEMDELLPAMFCPPHYRGFLHLFFPIEKPSIFM